MIDGSDLQVSHIRKIDPLGADAACARVPDMNSQADVAALVRTLQSVLPHEEETRRFDIDESVAAVRDIGLFLGSIKRHGEEPLKIAPEATPVLLELGSRTDMVPRDVVHHYCTWNPTDDRRRRYTHDEQEAHLQEAVRMVFPHLRAALELCRMVRDLDPVSTEFGVLLDALKRELEPMVDSISMVLEKVSPEFFALVLRPYFEEITVDGRELLGPAAAQVPLWLVDEAVWASDRSAPGYTKFLDESVPYSLPRWRRLHADWVGSPSLVTRLLEAYERTIEETGHITPELYASIRSMAALLRTIVMFRGKHMVIARQAYQEELRLYSFGSGGAPVELLREIIELTRENAQLTKEMGKTRAAYAGAGAR